MHSKLVTRVGRLAPVHRQEHCVKGIIIHAVLYTDFPEYQVKCYDFEPVAASDSAESLSNLAHSEQFNDANRL